MSSKQLLRLALILLVALVAWGAVALASHSGRTVDRERLVAKVDTTAVDTIVIIDGRDTVHVVRSLRRRWEANGYPASSRSVGQLLSGLVDTGTTAELIAMNPSSHRQFGVSDDSARQVRVVSHGPTVMRLLAGHRTPTGDGLYVRRVGEPKTYLLRGPLVEPLAQRADEWYERTIATIPIDSVDTIEIRRDATAYTLRRANHTWTLASGKLAKPADSTAVANLLAQFRAVVASGFATKAQLDSLHFDPPHWRVRLVKHDGKVLADFALDSIASGVWLRQDSGGLPYRIDAGSAARMIPGDTAFRHHH